jgi:hypothetical protein
MQNARGFATSRMRGIAGFMRGGLGTNRPMADWRQVLVGGPIVWSLKLQPSYPAHSEGDSGFHFGVVVNKVGKALAGPVGMTEYGRTAKITMDRECTRCLRDSSARVSAHMFWLKATFRVESLPRS